VQLITLKASSLSPCSFGFCIKYSQVSKNFTTGS